MTATATKLQSGAKSTYILPSVAETDKQDESSQYDRFEHKSFNGVIPLVWKKVS